MISNSNMFSFYDTNVLLYSDTSFLNNQKEVFYLSSITIEQLQNIKTSFNKDQSIKYRARQVIRWLSQNESKYNVIMYDEEVFLQKVKSPFSLIDSNDKKIILSVLYLKNTLLISNVVFFTYDLNCYLLAKHIAELDVKYTILNEDDYKGYIKIFCKTEEELSNVYSQIIFNQDYNNEQQLNLYINEYILIYDKDNVLVDKYRYTSQGFVQVQFISTYSKMFGKIKPIDSYQELVLDSFKSNTLTLVKGQAGTGKSLLSLAYLFKLLEQNRINKIIIFCNTVATAGSAKLGFYPGNRTEKLLDSQIGNFLISKLGARQGVQRLIEQEQLLLLPMSDIRGFDTSGTKAGIYITQAQNLSINLLKLALQRIGDDSICILDGDNVTQVDLNIYSGSNNGLKRVSQVFRGYDFYGQITLQTIHRSKIAEVASKM